MRSQDGFESVGPEHTVSDEPIATMIGGRGVHCQVTRPWMNEAFGHFLQLERGTR
jgi:hypothetical protein